MKEIVMNVSDETYQIVLSRMHTPMREEYVSLEQALKFNPWLADLLAAAERGAERAELLKHNKGLSHIFEQEWFKEDCERYNITPKKYIETIAFGHPIRTIEKLKKDIPEGIPKDDPEYHYIQKLWQEDNAGQ